MLIFKGKHGTYNKLMSGHFLYSAVTPSTSSNKFYMGADDQTGELKCWDLPYQLAVGGEKEEKGEKGEKGNLQDWALFTFTLEYFSSLGYSALKVSYVGYLYDNGTSCAVGSSSPVPSVSQTLTPVTFTYKSGTT